MTYQWYQWYHWQQKSVQGFLVTIGKNGTNSTIGRFADFTVGRTPNVAIVTLQAFDLKYGQIYRGKFKVYNAIYHWS